MIKFFVPELSTSDSTFYIIFTFPSKIAHYLYLFRFVLKSFYQGEQQISLITVISFFLHQ